MKITIEDPIVTKENNLFLVELTGLNRERFKTDRSWDALDAKRLMSNFPLWLYSFSSSNPIFEIKKLKKIKGVSEEEILPFSMFGGGYRGKSVEDIISQLQERKQKYSNSIKKINLTIKQLKSIAKSKTQGVQK